MSVAAVVPFSDLINKPKHTLGVMARARQLRLRRRDAEDLMLTTVSRYEQDHAVVAATTKFVVALMRAEPDHALLLSVLPEVFPWVRFLSVDDTRMFFAELVETLRAVQDFDNLAPVAQLIVEWRHTAEVHADPHIAAVLAQDGDDYGSVPEPMVGPTYARNRRSPGPSTPDPDGVARVLRCGS